MVAADKCKTTEKPQVTPKTNAVFRPQWQKWFCKWWNFGSGSCSGVGGLSGGHHGGYAKYGNLEDGTGKNHSGIIAAIAIV